MIRIGLIGFGVFVYRAACYNSMGLFARAIEDYNFALMKDQEKKEKSERGGGNVRRISSKDRYYSHPL